MAYSGLITKYPVGRPLDDIQRAYQLKQKAPLRIDPICHQSVIKVNSTYLEVIDKWYTWKGAASALLLLFIVLFGALYASMVYFTLTREPGAINDDASALTFASGLILPFVLGSIWLLCRESFAYTHYPIRFNRRSRIVHVFRTNGTVLSIPWEKVFFTIGRRNQSVAWEVRGHVIAPDNITIKETFALSYGSSIQDLRISPGQVDFSDPVRAHWEFIRRYMEDGPEAVVGRIQRCLPISTRRESIKEGMSRIFGNLANAPRVIVWVMFLPLILVGVARAFAMRTSRIPQWPKEVDAACMIEPDDEYENTLYKSA